MKKIITIATAGLLILFLAFSFKSTSEAKKEYATIYYNDIEKEVSLSYSDGTYKTVEFEKTKGSGDQTQILKLINEQEVLGYKLVNYDYKIAGSTSGKKVTTVLLCK